MWMAWIQFFWLAVVDDCRLDGAIVRLLHAASREEREQMRLFSRNKAMWWPRRSARSAHCDEDNRGCSRYNWLACKTLNATVALATVYGYTRAEQTQLNLVD